MSEIGQRITPKTVLEMSKEELHSRLGYLKKRMKQASKNFEFYYYEELKSEVEAINKQLADPIRHSYEVKLRLKESKGRQVN